MMRRVKNIAMLAMNASHASVDVLNLSVYCRYRQHRLFPVVNLSSLHKLPFTKE